MSDDDQLYFDVLFVGGGPAGLAGAIKLAQLCKAEKQRNPTFKVPQIAVLEKGKVFGGHNLSGAILDLRSLNELFPNWQELQAPVHQKITKDRVMFLAKGFALEAPLCPPPLSNHGNYIISVTKLVQWLAKEAEKLGVELFPEFAVTDLIYAGNKVVGIKTGDKGIDKDGKKRGNYEPGIEIRAGLTILAEGSYGYVTNKLIKKFDLNRGVMPQSYATGCKELWEIPEGNFTAGEAWLMMGYPLDQHTFGGAFIYGLSPTQIYIGLVSGLDYRYPSFEPHRELQRVKTHPRLKKIFQGGKLISYGAKTIPEGGYYALGRLTAPGAIIIGDSAGLINVPKNKGIHYALKSGMLAAETARDAMLKQNFSLDMLRSYERKLDRSFVGREIKQAGKFRQCFNLGLYTGMIRYGINMFSLNLFPLGKPQPHIDADMMLTLSQEDRPHYQELKFDKQLTFDKLTDVFYSGTKHEEKQTCHLHIKDPSVCEQICKPKYGQPCLLFCPAGVYEHETKADGSTELKVSPANCLHCKTCEIKDPLRNIEWVPPEGGGGPGYTNM